jgi:hypothetical protein
MALYKVACGHCGEHNYHTANSDEESLQKHTESQLHMNNKADFDSHMSNFTHGKDHN